MRLIFTKTARRELIEIGDYIAHDNPIRAVTFIEELQAKAQNITNMPYLYPIVKNELRRCNHKNYAIFFEVRDNAIFIKHIYHAARNLTALI
jgi:toxin ParE1/3/4